MKLFVSLWLVGGSALAAAPPVTVDTLERVDQRRVFFAHQSVGANILEGIQRVSAQLGRPLRLSEAAVGENERPLSKIEHFQKLVTEGPGRRAGIAFYKFCYVDFDATTDVAALFAHYVKGHEALQARVPHVRLVHVTAPLTEVQSGFKGWVKRTFGRGAWGERENAKRHQFNELLRTKYVGREPVFDLAKLESTLPDGSHATFELSGRRYPKLAARYTSDGQHLNPEGQDWVARHLLAFLAEVPLAEGAAATP